jgi:hypothetical protein
MRGHAFWQALYYNLQLHPDWQRKYSDQHAGATGDETTLAAVKAYRKRNPYLESEPLTEVSLEKQTRAVFFEFVVNDPWYFIELKYFNAIIIVDVVKTFLSQVWASLPWPFLILAACTAVGLATRVRTRAENLSTLTWCTVAMVVLIPMVAAPTWVTVVTKYAVGCDSEFSRGVLARSFARSACRQSNGADLRLAGCAPATGSAGHAGAITNLKLTFHGRLSGG